MAPTRAAAAQAHSTANPFHGDTGKHEWYGAQTVLVWAYRGTPACRLNAAAGNSRSSHVARVSGMTSARISGTMTTPVVATMAPVPRRNMAPAARPRTVATAAIAAVPSTTRRPMLLLSDSSGQAGGCQPLA